MSWNVEHSEEPGVRFGASLWVIHIMIFKQWVILVMLGCSAFLIGCSYQFAGSGSLPSGMTRIYISVIQNKTAEVGIENYLTDSLINEFMLRRKNALATQENADGVLTGSIMSISDTVIAHSTQTTSIQSRVSITANLKLTDTHGKVVWAVNGINANQAYNVLSSDRTVTDQNKKAAIQVLSKRLAETIFNRLTDDF